MRRACFILVLLVSHTGCHPNWNWLAPAPQALPLALQPQLAPPASGAPFVAQPLPPTTPPPSAVPLTLVPQPPPLPQTPPPRPSGIGSLSGPISPDFGLPAAPLPATALPNPLRVPVTSDEIAWEQIADVVSDYFPISSERRARRTPEIATAGVITTAPISGATILEPQRGDSADAFNRWESTFQTIRRIAVVEVIPEGTGYAVGIVVQKELEDLPQPEEATAGRAIIRNDTSLPDRDTVPVNFERESPLWIPLGRDVVLEQKMLSDIQSRFGAAPQPLFAPPPQ